MPPPTTTTWLCCTGSNNSNKGNTAEPQQAELVRKKPKIPFDVNDATYLRNYTLDVLTALTRETDEWTDTVREFGDFKAIIILHGIRKERANSGILNALYIELKETHEHPKDDPGSLIHSSVPHRPHKTLSAVNESTAPPPASP